MFMWTLSGLDRFMPRIKALKKEGIEFLVLYENEDLTPGQFSEWARDVSMYKVFFKEHPSYLKWLYSTEFIYRQVKDLEFDAIFSLSGIWFQYYSEYIAKKMGKPYILFLRGDGFEAPRLQERNWIKRSFRTRVYKNNGWNCDKVIPITEDLIPLALNQGVPAEKIMKPIPGGIDTDLFSPKPVYKPRTTIGYAGRVNKEKGSKFLSKLIRNNPDIAFNIAGPIQTDFPVFDNVDHWGKVDHELMPVFYNACDLVIMTSKIEGFPRVLLEGYACGKPAIVTRESIPTDCEIHGFVLPRDLDLWGDAFYWLNKGHVFYSTTARRARQYALTMGLEEYAREMSQRIRYRL